MLLTEPPEAPPLARRWVIVHRLSLLPLSISALCHLGAPAECPWFGAAIAFGGGVVLGPLLLIGFLVLIPIGTFGTFAFTLIRLRGVRGLVAAAATQAERTEAILLAGVGLLLILLIAG